MSKKRSPGKPHRRSRRPRTVPLSDQVVSALSEHLAEYGMRHYTASTLLSRRASLLQVSAVLGHASSTVTPRAHVHFMPGDEERTREQMSEAFGDSGGMTQPPPDSRRGLRVEQVGADWGTLTRSASISPAQAGYDVLYACLVSYQPLIREWR